MKRLFLYAIFIIAATGSIYSQKNSFIVLGDLHYDRIEDHDMEWLRTKPDDLRQVTKEYTVYTEKNWADLMSVIRSRIATYRPSVRAVVQLGDLSEGLAGTPEKAKQMAAAVVNAVENSSFSVPWIIAKGNHDVTGPGAPEAFMEHYVPMFRKQTGNQQIANASYSYRFDDVQVTCIDPWDRETDMVAFLDKELSSSDAKFKFVAVHEPVIPVTERCWHTLRRTPPQREKLLEVIARNRAIVLCAHLHRYSVVRRETEFGPIVQVMTVSVIKDRDYKVPDKVINEYGPVLAKNLPDYQPETIEERMKMLGEEAPYVTYYTQTNLPGYAVITTDSRKNRVSLSYYPGFGDKPYEVINLSRLQNK